MKYDITHACGCTETVNICGTNVHGERDQKVAWLESIPCRECEAKAKADTAEEAGLCELSGSSKQVSWALDIRNEMIANLTNEGEKIIACSKGNFPDEAIEQVRQNIAKATDNIKAVEDAKWFIDNRFCTHFSSLLKLALCLGENA